MQVRPHRGNPRDSPVLAWVGCMPLLIARHACVYIQKLHWVIATKVQLELAASLEATSSTDYMCDIG